LYNAAFGHKFKSLQSIIIDSSNKYLLNISNSV